MNTKLIRRGAIAGLVLASALTLSAQAAFGATPGEPVVTGPQVVTETPAPAPAPAPAPEVTLDVSEISLDGPAIAEVDVTVVNESDSAMRSVSVTFEGPVGWQVAVVENDLGNIKPGTSETATFQVRIPEKRSGFALRVFTAEATYKGGDGAGSAAATRAMPTAAPLENLAAAFNSKGITSESAPTAGDFDGEGNTFSAEKLAAAGAGKGAELDVLGATLHMPSVEPGTPDNVATAGQAVRVQGEGERLVLLGSGSGTAATGTVTVYYSDGTAGTGSVGFPNWSFQAADAHGAQLVVSTDGRNRPNGYGDAAYQYRLFAHSVPLEAGKTVEFVVLPGNAAMHVFAMGIAP
ncbi:NEW3 domain-containing protein [Agromyces humatus]|uniref:Alpha-galactosidase NEW3 domain-containing protein n=1 Tax=Agromyces humatus TaxID=279573 RepID=A0ABP4WTZ6_9MICO|nr:NEW3 domain-containing protein [Agromyces humatus]